MCTSDLATFQKLSFFRAKGYYNLCICYMNSVCERFTMNKSSRGYKLLNKCKNMEDSNRSERALGSCKKVTHGNEYWSRKRVDRWFCNQPPSPAQNDGQSKVHVLQNVVLVPDHSKEDDGNARTPTDSFSDSGGSSYRPSNNTESSSAPEGSFSDFNVYTPEEVANSKSDESSDLHRLDNQEQCVAKKPFPFFDAYTDLHIIDISGNNDTKHEKIPTNKLSFNLFNEPDLALINSAADFDHHNNKTLAASKDISSNNNTKHEGSSGEILTSETSIIFLDEQGLVITNTATNLDHQNERKLAAPKDTHGNSDIKHEKISAEISANKVSVNLLDEQVPLLSNTAANLAHNNDKKLAAPKKLKNFCYYCETDVTNFARHINNNHSHEIDVVRLNSLPLKSLERKRLLAKLRNKGNYLNSANSCPRRVRRACVPDTPVLPCDNCLGFFSSKLLYRHRKKCGVKRSGRAQSEGQTILASKMRIDERLKREVFPRMRADQISLEAKSDKLICAFGARYLNTHREKHFATVTSRKMRELSKVLVEIKKMNPEVKSLFQALHPRNFDLFVQATQIVARYDPLKEHFEVPTFAMNIVNSFKQCCDIAINFVLRGLHQCAVVPNAEAEAGFRTMKHLFEANWRFEVSSLAASNLNLNKWNKTTIVPLASDLKLFMSYLIDIAGKAIEKLNTNTKDVSAYNSLVETIYCRLILLNRRRPGELQRMLLDIYMNCGNDKEQYQEFENVITKSERVLLKRLKRVVIRGKRGRGVPVLFSNDVQEHIKVMLENRSKFVPVDNVYLFAKAGSSNEISGYKTLKKHADKCGAKNPNALTSTRLRKHLATLTQIFNMSDSDVEQLASFMGHTVGIHRGSYRLPDDVYQTAKLSKLLLLMERGQAGDYKGKTLEEIDLDMENDLLEEADGIESDVENETEIIDSENPLCAADANAPNTTNTHCGTKKKKRILIPWAPEEKKLAKKFFKHHIRSAKPPKRHECQELIDEHPDVFRNRDWLKMKVFIQNQYTKKKAADDDDD